MRYGHWTIAYDPPQIPVRDMDYVGVHEDYDGAPDSNDGRCLRGKSEADVLEQIQDMECQCDSADDPRRCRTCGTYPVCKACDDASVCSYCRPRERET